MGRRSTKTTKTGKFMNPTDQWRKQIRKKELKKNRQQRSAVREAVLRNKNPMTILSEIEEIEKMEIEAGPDEVSAEKGLKEKKRKLHETLQRIILFNERQNPQEAQKIKDLVVESEKKRRTMAKVYNSYRSARSQIDLSDIPLPEGTATTEDDVSSSVRSVTDETGLSMSLLPPGPPPGLPPDVKFPPAITTDEYLEGEDEDDASDSSDQSDEEESDQSDKEESVPPPPPPGPPPGYIQSQPSPLFPPPSHYPPPHVVGGTPSRFHPPPPPSSSVFGSKPSPHIQSSPTVPPSPSNQAPTISAQPQLRNVQAEVTKFMPTSLRVRRDQPKAIKAKMRTTLATKEGGPSQGSASRSTSSKPGGMKGDAYETFMKEMQGLL